MKRLIFLLCCVATPALAVCDVTMTGTVYDGDGNRAGYQTNGWDALPNADAAKVSAEGDKVVAVAQKAAKKGQPGAYRVVFTGSSNCDGVAKTDDPIEVTGLDAKDVVTYLKAAHKFGGFLVDWADSDAKAGKKHGWDHAKSKVKKDK